MESNLELLRNLIIKKYNLNVKSKRRVREVVDAKKIFCLIAFNEIDGFGYSGIARFLDVTHATVMHHVKKAKDHLKYDLRFKEMYHTIEEQFFLLNKDVLISQIDSEIYLCETRLDYLKKKREMNFQKWEMIKSDVEEVQEVKLAKESKLLIFDN